jgi:predicted lipid-binding transport protein (Tim44 family)
MRRLALLSGLLAFVLLVLAPAIADARGGRGGSVGSRGSQTYTAPPPTRTAPAPARPVERSMTETGPARAATPATAANPGAAGAMGGMAARNPFMTGLMGGILGAGLVGMLFGGGFFSGLGSMAGMLGFLLQLALIGGLVFLALRLFRGRQMQGQAEPLPAGAHARMGGGPIPDVGASRPMGAGAAGGSFGAPAAPVGAHAAGLAPVALEKADFDAFEATLKDVQAAWSEADLRALSGLLTPEMLQYFSEMLAEDASRGVRNRVTDVVLEEGDLSEAWREAGRDYATVAMRFSALDVDTRLSDGAVIAGDAAERTTATEYWTFVRAQGGRWLLSAIQQTG